MSSVPMSPLRRLWFAWKSLKLPWRKTFLVGSDLSGNTFWEFKDAASSNRFRRIVKSPSSTHLADVQISPQWHQWLRQTRFDAPSIAEQTADLQRQAAVKQLAKEADERWASKPSFLDKPKEQPRPATQIKDPGGYAGKTEEDSKEGVRNAVGGAQEMLDKKKSQDQKDPWEKSRSQGPSEGWQPQAWDPQAGAVRR
ncbi:MAG: hypothetical protein M1837_000049 [Sclerophora amabilis]|nr:MAG: hypothetical protein M1837_000049 [Sclerophora amabilis]